MDYTTLDDTVLVRLLVSKNADALSALYDRYGGLVFSLAFAVVHDHGAAEEVTQDVFLRVWDNASLYDQTQANFRSWLSRITRNRAIDILRKHRIRPEKHAVNWAEPSQTPLIDKNNSPERTIELRLQQDCVRGAIAQLPREQGEALQLAFLQGLTHPEIAQELQHPLGTIKTRIRLGMQKLRTLLQDCI